MLFYQNEPTTKWRIPSKNIPFLIYFLVWAVIHIQLELNFGDDVMFAAALNDMSWIEWSITKYTSFNSRIITESILVFVMRIGTWLWKIINLGMMVLIPWSISRIVFHGKATVRENTFIVCLMSLYPFVDMSTAGWGATAVNYTWVLALGLFSLSCVLYTINDIQQKKVANVLAILAALYAASVEQMGCIMFVFCIIALAYNYFKKKKLSLFLLTIFLVVFADLLVILLSPARSGRYLNEISYSFPSYGMLSLVDKFTIGLTSTMAQFIARANWVFLAFSLVVCICIFYREKSAWVRAGGMLPLLGSLIGFACEAVPTLFPGLRKLFYYEANMAMPDFAPITIQNCSRLVSYIPMAFSLVVLGGCIVSMLFLFKDEHFILPVLVILAGFCSRIMLAFSPSIYASARRTYMHMYFAFIIVTVMIVKSIQEDHPELSKKIMQMTPYACILPAINVLATVLCV